MLGKGDRRTGVEQEIGREGRTELQSGYFSPPAWKTTHRKPPELQTRCCTCSTLRTEMFLLPKQMSTFVERTLKRKKLVIYKRHHVFTCM